MVWTRRVIALVIAAFVSACASNAPPLAVATESPPTANPTLTKPPIASQAPLPAPTYVRWAIDKTGFADRPYFLDLFYDGVATNFRIVDSSGQVVLRVPIAGSGVFGPETCAVRARPPGKSEGFTHLVIDAETLQRFTANAASYRVEADSVGGRSVTVPLTDGDCRTL